MDSNTQDIFLEAMEKETEKSGSEVGTGPLKTGKVVAVNENDVFLDMGRKSEAIAPLSEFKEIPKVGDEVQVILKGSENGIYKASLKGAERMARMNEIRQAVDEDLPVKGIIKEVRYKDEIPKGFYVDLGYNIKAFLPYSHIDTRRVEKPEELIGEEFDFAVLEVRRDNVTVSRRQYLRKTVKKLYKQFFETHQVSDVIKGTVDIIENNYLLMNIEGIKAFMHISDFSWKYLKTLKDVVKRGDEMEVQIIQVDPSKDSVKVSKRALLPNPWETIADRLQIGQILNGTVIRFRRDGVMIEVEDGVEAYCHVDEMSWTERVRDPQKVLKLNDVVEVKIIGIDVENKRIDLSLREVHENPWDSASENYTIGRKLKGKVTSVVDFGVFVKFEDGIEGLLRKEDVDWVEENVNLKEKFKKGQEIQVVVLAVDARRGKLRLGVKQLSENPFEAFSMNYPKGSVVECEIAEILPSGAIVSLENDLRGFIHISQIAKERIENVEEHFKIGDKISAAVKFVDSSKKKIELSVKEMLLGEEKKEVAKFIVSGKDQEKLNTTSMGSLLQDQFKDIKVED